MEYYYLITFFDTHDRNDPYHGGITTCVTTSQRIEDPDTLQDVMDSLKVQYNVQGMITITLFQYLGCKNKQEDRDEA